MTHHPLLDDEKRRMLDKARRLQWVTLGVLASVIAVMGLTMGSSQAMRTAWYEDILSLVPPIAFLVAARQEGKRPSERLPYGRLAASTIAFLCASFALVVFGAWLLIDAVISLVSAHRPSIGTMTVFGVTAWAGWWMIAAVVYSAIGPFVLGRMKLDIARKLNDKTLFSDARMNKADWQTALATAAGVLGVGVGWWWADAAAAGLISLSILHDGYQELRDAGLVLLRARPTDVEKEPLDIGADVGAALERLSFVRNARVRLHEEGRFFSGEARILATRPLSAEDVEAAEQAAYDVDWRVHRMTVSWLPPDPPHERWVVPPDGS